MFHYSLPPVPSTHLRFAVRERTGSIAEYREDIEDSLRRLSLSSVDSVEKELAILINEYHFCYYGKVNPGFQYYYYLSRIPTGKQSQRRLEGKPFALHNPSHSEVNENIPNLSALLPIFYGHRGHRRIIKAVSVHDGQAVTANEEIFSATQFSRMYIWKNTPCSQQKNRC